MKTKKDEEENKLHRFGSQFITSLKPVQDKILRKEVKINQNEIFDFNWQEGKRLKDSYRLPSTAQHHFLVKSVILMPRSI